MILERIEKPSDVKRLKPKHWDRLASEIREFLIDKLSKTGGHLASNLGVVELTIAMYLSFDLPKDKIVWDVGHQSYTHKILSGRKKDFNELRMFGGLAGFPKTKESPCDAFNTGHSSTSISAGLGLANARELLSQKHHIVSVIGDGALTGGMAYEALNNAAHLNRNFIVVLNDNGISISENVGGISKYLNSIRTGDIYNTLKKQVYGVLNRIPVLGDPMIDSIRNTKAGIKQLFSPGMLFENMGITYLGPVDGHNIAHLKRVFQEAKNLDQPVLVHVITKKGKGYAPAERDPEKFHGVGAFDKQTGKALKDKIKPNYTDVFSRKLIELADKDGRIVAITAAMPDGTGLNKFGEVYPDRCFDVGIAEQHAVTMAAGMAAGGLKPVVAVYSSFLQRGFDQIIHDVCIQNLNVIFAIDRAGIVGADGETHQGIFDLSYLNCVPNMTILAPKNKWELEKDLEFACKCNRPIAIRYPRGQAYDEFGENPPDIEYGRGEIISEGENVALLAVGSMVSTAYHIREKLAKKDIDCGLINARFIKPIDYALIDEICLRYNVVVTLEENVLAGGFGLMVCDYIAKKYPDVRVCNITIPDAYIEHGDVSVLRSSLGIDSDSIIDKLYREGYIK